MWIIIVIVIITLIAILFHLFQYLLGFFKLSNPQSNGTVLIFGVRRKGNIMEIKKI